MAIRGRKPKPKGQAVHRGQRVHEWTDVPSMPFTGAPKLPTRRCNGRPWPARTREKWKAWSSMPHCVLWQPPDWSFALDSLELAAIVHEGDSRYAGELRAREEVLATTGDALRDQRIRYVDPPNAAEPNAAVADIAQYRDL
jgi:hypothetical protein